MQTETAIRKLEIERFGIRTSKPFESVVDALKASVGRLNVGELSKTSKSAASFSDLEKLIGKKIKLVIITVQNPQTGEMVRSLAVSPKQQGR